MDGWNVAQNWAIFVPVVAGLTAYYYWPRGTGQQNAVRNKQQPAPTVNSGSVKSGPSKSPKKPARASTPPNKEKTPKTAVGKQNDAQRKVERKEPVAAPDTDEAVDQDAKEFARRLTQARQGIEVKKAEAKGSRVKTIKQSSAFSDADDEDFTPVSGRDTSGVADMLEPTAPGPSTLRILPSEKSVKAKGQEKTKKENKDVKSSKKARQNERKKEAERAQREEDEKQRKILEEKQRRTAREARGEAAKNGLAPAKAPASSSWTAKSSASISGAPAEAASNSAALLDTFDAESTSSSNAEASTAATSTTDGAPSQWIEDAQSGAEDVSRAVKESLDDAAWTTAGSKRKQKKSKAAESSGDATPTVKAKPAPPPTSAPTQSKPTGFHALVDEYEQRTNVDASDASNWDA